MDSHHDDVGTGTEIEVVEEVIRGRVRGDVRGEVDHQDEYGRRKSRISYYVESLSSNLPTRNRMIMTVNMTVVFRDALLIFLCRLIVDICRLSSVLKPDYCRNQIKTNIIKVLSFVLTARMRRMVMTKSRMDGTRAIPIRMMSKA